MGAIDEAKDRIGEIFHLEAGLSIRSLIRHR
jgi:hypothetical protein